MGCGGVPLAWPTRQVVGEEPIGSRLRCARTVSWSWNATWLAWSRRSSLKSPFSRLLTSRPTTTANTTRMTSVRVADTAASRQRTGQRLGVRAARMFSSLFIPSRLDDVPGATLGVQDTPLAAGLELSAQVRD